MSTENEDAIPYNRHIGLMKMSALVSPILGRLAAAEAMLTDQKKLPVAAAVDFDRIIVEVAYEKVPRACGLVLMGPLPAGRSLAASNDVGQQSALFASLTRQALRFFQPILLGRC